MWAGVSRARKDVKYSLEEKQSPLSALCVWRVTARGRPLDHSSLVSMLRNAANRALRAVRSRHAGIPPPLASSLCSWSLPSLPPSFDMSAGADDDGDDSGQHHKAKATGSDRATRHHERFMPFVRA